MEIFNDSNKGTVKAFLGKNTHIKYNRPPLKYDPGELIEGAVLCCVSRPHSSSENFIFTGDI